MNQQTYDDVQDDASKRLEEQFPDSLTQKLQAAKQIEESLTEMTDQGRVLKLTDEEERMLLAFRQFKCVLIAGRTAKFRWKTRASPGEIIQPPAKALIVDPQDANDLSAEK